MSSGRFPIRPLDYANRNLAVPRELLLDYEGKTLFFSDENGNIVKDDDIYQLLDMVRNYDRYGSKNESAIQRLKNRFIYSK